MQRQAGKYKVCIIHRKERTEKMGLVEIKREITKEKYEKIMEKNGFVSSNDSEIFADWEIWGYGVYSPKVIEEDGKYYVKFERGSSCD